MSLNEDKVIKELILILDEIDNIYRFAISSKNDLLINNFDSALKNIKKYLDELGIESIYPIGEIFDNKVHECVQTVEDCSKKQYEIVDIIKRGYKHNGKVIRPAYVVAVK